MSPGPGVGRGGEDCRGVTRCSILGSPTKCNCCKFSSLRSSFYHCYTIFQVLPTLGGES